MKTNYYNSRKMSIYTLLGIFTLLMASCGSYQNKSYYDRDGIYGTENKKNEETATNDNQNKSVVDDKYTNYFNSLRDDQQDEVFTDVEKYTSYNDTINKERNNNASWGSNPSNVTVNVYDTNWGWNNGWYGNNWGWNNLAWNSWYGPNWGWNNWYGGGWGWNSWYGGGWGWNNGWNNGWCGNGFYGSNFNNNYTQTNGRRGSTYGRPEGNSPRNYGRNRNNTITRATSITGSRRADYAPTRTTAIRNSGSPVRFNNSNTTRSNSSSTTRNNSTNTTTSPTRNNTYTPSTTTRSNTYTPSSNSSSTRSSSGSGGGRSSGGGGGTRSGGGGRR